jgi:acyl carrier protein
MTDAIEAPRAVDTAPGPVQPRDAREEAVAAIWRDVLDRRDVGVHDDFFDLAGSSLQAIEVVTRAKEAFGVDVRARDFFATPTVAALAGTIAARSPSDRVLVTPRSAGAAPVLSLDQERLWLEDQLLPGAAYNVHERRRISGALDAGAVERSIRAIRDRHESLRTRFPTVDGAPVQVVDPPSGRAVDVVDLRASAGDRLAEACRLADEQATTPFDLAADPLLRCLLVVLDEGDHVLAVTAHHIVCDNWSIMVFLREFVALYRAGGDVAASGLPALPVQYLDHAVQQRRWLAGERFETQVGHWRRHLDGAPAALALPTTGRGLLTGGNATGRVSVELSDHDTLVVGDLCRESGATRFMVVLAAVGAVLGRWSGQTDVVVGVPVTGRNDPTVAGLIGFFVNTLPLRVDVAPGQTFDALLEQVRAATLAGYAHGDVPLDLVVREVRAAAPERGTAPLFQVLLSAIDTDDVGTLDGLRIEPMDPPPIPSKVDLAFATRVSADRLRLDLEFDAVRHSPAMMQLLVDQVGALLRVAADDPGQDIAGYDLG